MYNCFAEPSKPVNVIGAPINDSAIRLNWNEVKGDYVLFLIRCCKQ